LAFDALAARFFAGAFLVLALEAFMAFARPVFAPVFFAAFFVPVDFALVAIGLSPRCRRSVRRLAVDSGDSTPCTDRPACNVQAHKAVFENGGGKSSAISRFLHLAAAVPRLHPEPRSST